MLLIDWISKVVRTDVFLGAVLKTKIFFSLVYTQKFMFSEKDTNIWSYFPSKELSKLMEDKSKFEFPSQKTWTLPTNKIKPVLCASVLVLISAEWFDLSFSALPPLFLCWGSGRQLGYLIVARWRF